MISIISPSIRKGALDMLAECLKKQTFTNWEWVVSTNYDPPEPAIQVGTTEKGEFFYRLNADWNRCFRKAKGELFISIVDETWIGEDFLEMFWTHYQTNPKRLIGGVGDQYERVISGKPEIIVWKDPRKRNDLGSFYEINPIDLEWCCTSIPRKAIYDIGGMDENWDRYAALSEKSACLRMDQLGYTFWLDQSLEYRALGHPRLNGKEAWDKAYQEGCKYLDKTYPLIKSGIGIKLDFLS